MPRLCPDNSGRLSPAALDARASERTVILGRKVKHQRRQLRQLHRALALEKTLARQWMQLARDWQAAYQKVSPPPMYALGCWWCKIRIALARRRGGR